MHRVPYPPDRGDRIRSYHILKHLAEYAEISLATLADEPVSEANRNVLNSLARRVAIAPLGRSRWVYAAARLACGGAATEGLFQSSRLRARIRQWCRETRFDAVFAFCSSMVQYADITELREIPLVVDLVDVDSQKFFDYAALARGLKQWLYRLEGQRLRKIECSLPKRAQAITLVSEQEADLYRGFCPNDRTVSIPNGVDLEYFRPEPTDPNAWTPLADRDRTNLVFIGALDYQANVDGITWFVNTVWPVVRRQLPELTLGLVGRNPCPSIQALGEIPGIRIFPNVPDVRPYLAAADMAIAPLRIARGIQNKVLEAMAMGKPVICSPAAAEGIGGFRDALIVKEPATWVEAIRSLLTDRGLYLATATALRDCVERRFAWDASLKPLWETLLPDEMVRGLKADPCHAVA